MNAAAEIIRYRSLLWFLSLREWKEQTRRTFLGFFWVLAYPFVLGGIVSVLFGRLVPSGETPYPAMIFCAMIPWQLFSQTLLGGCGILKKNGDILRKIRFPTEVLLLSHLACRTLQFLVSFGVLEIFLHAWGFSPGLRALQILPWLMLQSLLALGILFLLTPIGLITRDVEQGLGLFVLLWFYATPVIYPLPWIANALPGKLLLLYLANPMAAVVEGYRSALLGGGGILEGNVLYQLLITAEVLVLFFAGYFFYKKTEPYFSQNA